MRRLLPSLAALLIVLSAPLAGAAESIIDWSANPPLSGEVTGDEVHVSGEGAHLLVVIEDPDITSDSYVIRGSVRYEDVSGPGYLEMWSHFSDGGAYFSRTLAAEGPLAALDGSSAGRDFELPFILNGATPPDRLEIGVVLPGGGDVWVGPLTLDAGAGVGQWWPTDTAGLIGALAGTPLGIGGALVGVLMARRRNVQMASAILRLGLGLGVVGLVVGIVALVVGQPAHVWAPLLIIGGVSTVVTAAMLSTMSRRLAEAELHRIHALDSGAG